MVVFLSDGECDVADETVYDLCRTAVRLGFVYVLLLISEPMLIYMLRKPLAFHAVSFGQDTQAYYLRRMAAIADEVYAAAPKDPLAPSGFKACTYASALDTASHFNHFNVLPNVPTDSVGEHLHEHCRIPQEPESGSFSCLVEKRLNVSYKYDWNDIILL